MRVHSNQINSGVWNQLESFQVSMPKNEQADSFYDSFQCELRAGRKPGDLKHKTSPLYCVCEEYTINSAGKEKQINFLKPN